MMAMAWKQALLLRRERTTKAQEVDTAAEQPRVRHLLTQKIQEVQVPCTPMTVRKGQDRGLARNERLYREDEGDEGRDRKGDFHFTPNIADWCRQEIRGNVCLFSANYR